MTFQEETQTWREEVQARRPGPTKADPSPPVEQPGRVALAFTAGLPRPFGRSEGSTWALIPKGQGRSFCHLLGVAHSMSDAAGAAQEPGHRYTISAHSTHIR